MINMNFNTILRCNKYGLRTINAISLARLIEYSEWIFLDLPHKGTTILESEKIK